MRESFLVLFFKKEPLAYTQKSKRFFLKKEAKTFFPYRGETQAPPCRLEAIAASMNLMPAAPSSTVGRKREVGDAARPSHCAVICSAASA
jgi:hypothetical protein